MGITFDKEFKTEVSGANTSIEYNDDGAFYNGTELSKKQIKDVFDHTENYIAEATKAGASKATDIFKNDDSVETVKVKFPFTPSKRGHIVLNIDKAFTKTNNFSKEKTTSPYIKVEIKNPFSKISRERVKELEGELAKAIA